MRTVTALGLALAPANLAGCTSSASTDGGDQCSKYEQTWEKPYKRTTCGDWAAWMSRAENFAFAADAIVALWTNADPDVAELPADELVEQLGAEITDMCSTPLIDKPVEAVRLIFNADPMTYKH